MILNCFDKKIKLNVNEKRFLYEAKKEEHFLCLKVLRESYIMFTHVRSISTKLKYAVQSPMSCCVLLNMAQNPYVLLCYQILPKCISG